MFPIVLHEAAESGVVLFGEVGELDAEAHVAQVVEDAASGLPPVGVWERDAYVYRLVVERLDCFGL